MKHTVQPYILCLLAILVSACSAPKITLSPTPTAIPRSPLILHDRNLLADPRVAVNCDQNLDASIQCLRQGLEVSATLTSNPGSFVRLSLRFDGIADPLTGDETLLLTGEFESNESPYLYLVESDGRRTSATLSLYQTQPGFATLALPLREITDEDGKNANFPDVREVQLVFQYVEVSERFRISNLEFASVWSENVQLRPQTFELAKGIGVPAGFAVQPIADTLDLMTKIVFTPQGDMLVSLQNGRIWWYSDRDEAGLYHQRHLWAAGFEEVVGLLYDASDGAVWVGGRGKLYRTFDSNNDGVADQRELRIDGLPWGRHQNNGMVWGPDPDPFTGETGAGWIYFGLGSTDDLDVGGELNASILRFPRTGSSQDDLQVVSRGNRNAYGIVWAAVPVDLAQPDGPTTWQLFASENGPDFNDAPDEVNHIRWQHDYGFPDQFGPVADSTQEGKPYSSPVTPVTAHASADGLAYINNQNWPAADRTLYVSLFGEVFSPIPVGHTVDRITLHEVDTPDGKTYRGDVEPFITGIERPLPLAVGPRGNLIVGGYATGVIYRVHYVGLNEGKTQ